MLMNLNIEQPREVMYVFDNDGFTEDRYTIVLMYEDGESFTVISSANPTHPNGRYSADEGYDDDDVDARDIGDEIYWWDLPEEVQKAVINNFDYLTYEDDDEDED